MKMLINLSVIINLTILYSCNSNENKNTFNKYNIKSEIAIINGDSDLGVDSVKVIDRDYYFLSDSTKVERTIYIDYRKISDEKKQLIRIDSIFNSNAISVYEEYISPKPFRDTTIFNPFIENKRTYIEISRLNDNDILFAQGNEVEYTMVNLRDSLIGYNYTENWYLYYYKSLEKADDIIKLEIFNGHTRKTNIIWIKTINHENGIQIWKNAIPQWDDSIIVSYKLMAPLEYALNIPFLYISNPMGLDSFYDGIDNLNWKSYFE